MQAIPISEPVARVHAEVWAQLAEAGQVIGAHELWIAATRSPTAWPSRRATPPTSSASPGCG